MAINIYSGNASNKSGGSKAIRTSTAADRAQATTAALGSSAVASTDGTTAVKSSGMGSKIKNLLTGVSGFASKLPGVAGVVGSVANKLLSANDPEWWMSVPGDGVTTNNPLAHVLEAGEYSSGNSFGADRPAFLEIVSSTGRDALSLTDFDFLAKVRVMQPTTQEITQYLMPQVRKVANAVYLQSAEAYGGVLSAWATAYAMWRQLKKYDEFLKIGHTFLPNLNESAFPLFQVQNAAYLQSTITRLEEYLRASVRLPHTLCEYLAWRFGRVYRTANSAKAAFVFYNAIPMSASIEEWNLYLEEILSYTSSSENLQKAATDLYNAYVDHDQEVLILPESQCTYDVKEFALRTNLDLIAGYGAVDYGDSSLVIMDSNLDNPTSFMSSTVSSRPYMNEDVVNSVCLFPVAYAQAWLYDPNLTIHDYTYTPFIGQSESVTIKVPNYFYVAKNTDVSSAIPSIRLFDDTCPLVVNFDGTAAIVSLPTARAYVGSKWYSATIYSAVMSWLPTASDSSSQHDSIINLTWLASLCKSLEFYNKGIYMPLLFSSQNAATVALSRYSAVDLTVPSQDSALVPDIVLEHEQVFAFANLVHPSRKMKESVKTVEKEVAKPVADLVASTPIAQVPAKATVTTAPPSNASK